MIKPHKHHHGNHGHKKNGYESCYSQPPPLGYPPIGNSGPVQAYAAAAPPPPAAAMVDPYQQDRLNQAVSDYKRHSRNERIAEVTAIGAGAFALYEAHEAKVDPAHASRHKMEAKVAGAVAVGSVAYARHEHKQKKKDEKIIESLGGYGYKKSGNLLTNDESKHAFVGHNYSRSSKLLTNDTPKHAIGGHSYSRSSKLLINDGHGHDKKQDDHHKKHLRFF